MSKPSALMSFLLVSSALVAPSVVFAQAIPTAAGETPAPPAAPASEPVEQQTSSASSLPGDNTQPPQPDVSIPGAAPAEDVIVVRGRRNANIQRNASQVVSILSSADIARTGEGNIAGALGRVTGLSVVGNGFVYVRGLGDRYSLAMLNGSPLPSPEPLKRVVPLDIFPSSVVASSLVQKTYSANFPGEFGGGVINLTTKAVPNEPFLSVGASIGGDSETTGRLGYTHYGTGSDWTGYGVAARNYPAAFAEFFKSGLRTSEVDASPIAAGLITGNNAIVQKNNKIPVNWGLSVAGGTSFDMGDDSRLGVIASIGYSNKWRTRDVTQQTSSVKDLSDIDRDFRRVITDNRVLLNGLFGLGYEFGRNKLRWTNLYIHDSLKQTRLGMGTNNYRPDLDILQQNTSFIERQLIDTQFVGELRPTDALSVDVRAGYANTKRLSPFETNFEYIRDRSRAINDPLRGHFINRLDDTSGYARINFSRLNENLWFGGLDVTYRIQPGYLATLGYAFTDTQRNNMKRDFRFTRPQGDVNELIAVSLLRPDYLLHPQTIERYKIGLEETNPYTTFDSKLRVHAAYGQVNADITENLNLNAGVRFEKGSQSVEQIQIFKNPQGQTESFAPRKKTYWLPAATATWKLGDSQQLRFNVSQTIARPQFRELIFQRFYDPDQNRNFYGNPFLQDSKLLNAEARYEWYFGRDQKLAVAGFFKRIDKPIEVFSSYDQNEIISSFANAPRANLYGGEIEFQKYFDMADTSSDPFWSSRQAVLIGNYTFTQSKIKVGENDRTQIYPRTGPENPFAKDYFRDGTSLTGQSNHIFNVQLGFEDKDRLSQQTLLFSYASDRVSARGAGPLPDIKERPGLQVDFVAREGIKIGGADGELKLELRNIAGTEYKEFQQAGDRRIYVNRYKVGTTANLGVSVTF